MFVGTAEHSIDNKNRMFVKANWRKQFGDYLYAVKSGKCHVTLVTEEAFEQALSKIDSDSSIKDKAQMRRNLGANSIQLDIDNQGRITLPQSFVDHLGVIMTGQKLVCVGCGHKVEVWDSREWQDVKVEESYTARI